MSATSFVQTNETTAIGRQARVFLAVIAVLGFVQLLGSALTWRNFGNPEFLLYFAAAVIASLFPLKRVGNGISLSVPFVLLAIVELNTPGAVLIGCVSVLVQFLRSVNVRDMTYQVVVGVAIQAMVIATAKFVLESVLPQSLTTVAVRILVAAIALFVANTLPAAITVRLKERGRLGEIWKESYSWSLPFYLVSGAVALAANRARDGVDMESALAALIVAFLAYRYYRHRKVALETERHYAGQMAALHIRAIEGLALAVEAKDNLNTRGHLRRVQAYSLAVGKEMGLGPSELEALRAGALLHDIGKLAVPDHILTKPGKLTPQEFAKMKVHPLVGAEIVEQMQFPYPVAPIVREHHEKWNGSGYPFGLKGEEISLGARILTTVDCLDALLSDREYRKGIPVDEAMEYIAAESGKSFDPNVVAVLQRVYRSVADQGDTAGGTTLSVDAQITNGNAPDAGLDLSRAASGSTDAPSFLSAIAAAYREEDLMRRITSSVTVLELNEVLPRIDRMLQKMIVCDAVAIFLMEANALRVEFASGAGSAGMLGVEVALGEGLTGWVAEQRQAVVNGNPSVDPGFPGDAANMLRAALSIPLQGSQDMVGVLALYRKEHDSFTGDDLRILSAVTPNISQALENAVKYKRAQAQARLDPLTGFAGSDLFLQKLSQELSRARRQQETLWVVGVEVHANQENVPAFEDAKRDELIARVGNALKHSCREYDCIGRIGANSFAMVLPAAKSGQLSVFLDRIRLLVTQDSLEDHTPHFSIGGATYPEDGDGARNLLTVAQRRGRHSPSDETAGLQVLARTLDQSAHVEAPARNQ